MVTRGRGRRVRGPLSRDAGFTLIEVLVAIMLAGILMAIAVPSWRSYQRAADERGTAESIVSVLRNSQQRAVAEGRIYCVRFFTSAGSWSVYRTSCGSGTALQTGQVQGSSTTLTSAAFDQPSGGQAADAYFYASAKAGGGSVKVNRTGSTTSYTITVEGLTGRVSVDH